MRYRSGLILVALAGMLLTIPADLSAKDEKASSARWYIYSDAGVPSNHGYWTNYMPENGGQMIQLNMADTSNPYQGNTAIRVDVTFRSPGWCGIAVASAPNYWGQQPDTQVFNLKNARRLVFHARGQRGGETIQIKFAITGDQPFGDSSKIPIASKWFTLSTEWNHFELDLQGKNLTRVITPFVFVLNETRNSSPNLSFYLDEVYVEMN
jgi:hypothetical protein